MIRTERLRWVGENNADTIRKSRHRPHGIGNFEVSGR
jgi:hypothetical protein